MKQREICRNGQKNVGEEMRYKALGKVTVGIWISERQMQGNIPSGCPEQISRNADSINEGMDIPTYNGLEEVGYEHVTVGQ